MKRNVKRACPKCGEKIYTILRNGYLFTQSTCKHCQENKNYKYNGEYDGNQYTSDKPKTLVKKK